MSDICLACGSQNLCGTKHSEKDAIPFRTACCHRPICATCLNRRPRLKTYCIYCQSTRQSTSAETLEQEETSQFSINDFLEQEDGDEEDLPPAFEENGAADPPEYDPTNAQDVKDSKDCNLKDKASQAALHYIQPMDTFTGIALSYGVSPRLLARLNGLSPAVITSQPSLLHTRKFLLLPPGCQSKSATPVHDEAEERRRLCIRTFQMRTKCVDAKVAETYIDQIYEKRSQELHCVNVNRRARGLSPLESGDIVTEGGKLEEAIEAYNTDLKWEEEQRSRGQYTGSKLRRVPEAELLSFARRSGR